MGMASSKVIMNSKSKGTEHASYTSVNDFKFLEPLNIDSSNGLIFFNEIYVPEEVVSIILSFVPPCQLLKLSLVCKMWCNLIKSESVWMSIYERIHRSKAKKLPWYLYYCYFTTRNFKNLLKNGNGENKFKHWFVLRNLGDGFKIEDPPAGSDPLPEGVQDFNGRTSCFSTSYYECIKFQDVIIGEKRLLQYIIRKFKPHIYASEWVAGRFDCGCMYNLQLMGFEKEDAIQNSGEIHPVSAFNESAGYMVEQWLGKKWEKVEITVKDYPDDLYILRFQHDGRDTQFWKGNYGSKMAGGVLKFIFDSIEPIVSCEET